MTWLLANDGSFADSVMTRKRKSIWTLASVLLLAGCSGQKAASVVGRQPATRFPELELKERLQNETAVQAVPLKLHRSVNNGQGAEFVVPAAVAYSSTGNLYVSDNNTHSVHAWQTESSAISDLTLTSQVHPLKFPTSVEIWDGNIFVSDDEGIKVLGLDGKFQRHLRTYYGIFHFAISDKGTIFASVIMRKPDAQDPLIVEFDQAGKVVRKIGSRSTRAGLGDLENQGFVALSKNLLIVAFKYRPIVEVYNVDSGEMVRTFNVKHPVFASLGNESRLQQPNLVPRYVAGVTVVKDRIFLCLHLPVPEVWELNEEGKVLAELRADGLPRAIHVFGFDARLKGDEPYFAIGVLDPTWEASVFELSAS